MAEPPENEKLKARIAELEQQLEEEREEFEWDLKAAEESSQGTIKKLKEEIEQLKKSGSVPAGAKSAGGSEDVDMLSRRAMLAERRVAELQEELKRTQTSIPPPTPKGDSFQRQRAESAERERDELRREKRALERTIGDKEAALERLQKELADAKKAREDLEKARRELSDRERELKQVAQTAEQGAGLQEELSRLRSDLELAQSDNLEKEKKIRDLAVELNSLSAAEVERDSLAQDLEQAREQLKETQKFLEEAKVEADRSDRDRDKTRQQRTVELESEVNKLKQEIAQLKMASGQMVEQRERESERLKADLAEANERDSEAAKQFESARNEAERLRAELSLVKNERDELISSLSRLREDQQTQVTTPPASSGSDPFDEKTQKTSMPVGARESDAEPVVVGKAVPKPGPPLEEEEQTAKEIPAPADLQTVRDGKPLDSPEPSEEKGPQELEPFPLEEGASSQPMQDPKGGLSAVSGQARLEDLPDLDEDPEEGVREPERPPVQPMPSAEQQPVAEAEPPADSAAPESPGEDAQQPTVRLGPEVEPPTAGEEKASPQPRDQSEQGTPAEPLPMAESARVKQTGSGGLWWKICLFLVAAAGIVVGSLHFFPIWFGLGHTDGQDAAGTAIAVDDGEAEEIASADGWAGDAGDEGELDGEDGASDTQDAGQAAGEPDGGPAVADEESSREQLDPALKKAHAKAEKLIKRKLFSRAIRYTQVWARKHPDDPQIHYLLGYALASRRKWRAAAAELERVIEIDPQRHDAYFLMGAVFRKLRKRGQACEAYSAFLKLAPPDDRRLKIVKKQLSRLRCR